MSQKDPSEDMAKLLTEIRMLDGAAKEMEAKINMMDAALNDMSTSFMTLQNIKDKKGAEVLVPVGAGVYLKATIEDSEKVIMGIGADVAVEKNVDESVEGLRTRATELSSQRKMTEEQLARILARIEELKEQFSELSRSMKEQEH